MQDWFYSKYSNDELRAILYDATEEVYGSPEWLANAGRCTLAGRLEEVFARADQMPVAA
jgi:hypothetical protein